MTRRRYAYAIAMAAAALMAAHAFGRPPPGTDMESAEHAWFDGARTPGCVSCCGEGDGRFVMARRDDTSPLGWAVLLDGKWMPVPAGTRATMCTQAAPQDDLMPAGDYPLEPAAARAVVWILSDGTLFCFSPPGGGI